jgi:hypothetical protein
MKEANPRVDSGLSQSYEDRIMDMQMPILKGMKTQT